MLHGLERADGPVELHPLLGVGDRQLERDLGGPEAVHHRARSSMRSTTAATASVASIPSLAQAATAAAVEHDGARACACRRRSGSG